METWVNGWTNIYHSSWIENTLNSLMNFPRPALDAYNVASSLTILTRWYMVSIKILNGTTNTTFDSICWFCLCLIKWPIPWIKDLLLYRAFGRHKFYPVIVLRLLKTIQISLQLFISTLQICSLVIQKTFARLFHTISFLQLLFVLLKFYFPSLLQKWGAIY